MKLFAFLAIFAVLTVSTIGAWHGIYRGIPDYEQRNCSIKWDPNVISIDKFHLGSEICNYENEHPFPCFEAEGITVNCIFASAYPNFPGSGTLIRSISILFVNGRYREGYSVEGNLATSFESGQTLVNNDYTGEKWLFLDSSSIGNSVIITDFKSRTSIKIEHHIKSHLNWYNIEISSVGLTLNSASGMCVEGCPYGYAFQPASQFGRRKRQIEGNRECLGLQGSTKEETLDLINVCNFNIQFIPDIPKLLVEDAEKSRAFQAYYQKIFN